MKDVVIIVYMITAIKAGESAGSGTKTPLEVEVLTTDVLGRVRVPERKREAILDAFERSGLSRQAFATKWGLKYPTFATWIQKRRRTREEYPKMNKASVSKAFSLVEAVIDEDTPQEGASLEVEGKCPVGHRCKMLAEDQRRLLGKLLYLQ